MRAEELRYDRVVAVEDASRALEPEEGTLYGTPPKTWVEREDASWDEAQAKAVDEMFASYDSERKYVRGSGMPTLEEVLAGERAAETETGEAAAAHRYCPQVTRGGEFYCPKLIPTSFQDIVSCLYPVIERAGRLCNSLGQC